MSEQSVTGSSVKTTEPIPEEMQAVVVHAPEDYRLETVPVPTIGDDELLIKTEAVGVCASDLKCYHGAAKFWGDEHRPQWAENGRIFGHEIVGTIVAGGAEGLATHKVELGDRIAPEQIVPCWECRYCLDGAYWMCGPHDMFGFKGFDGGAAQYVRIPKRALVHKVEHALKPHYAAFAEPLSCGFHAVERADITFNDVVVIAGAGPIGLSAIAGVREKNPLKIISLDMVDDKLALAKDVGADLTINIKNEDPLQVVRDLTDGYGADVYIEATGHPSGVAQGLDILRKLGTYVEYSVFGSEVTVDWSIISDDKELNVYGAHLGPHTWEPAIKVLESGKLPMEQICTDQYGLPDFAQAIDLVADSSGSSVKVSILPNGPVAT